MCPGLPALLGQRLAARGIHGLTARTRRVGDSVILTTQLGTATYTSAPVPVDAEARFWVTPGGGGGATITSIGPPRRPSCRRRPPGLCYFRPTSCGRGDRDRDDHTRRPSGVGPGGSSIGADGTLGVGLDVVGPPEDQFDPAYLVTHDDARVTYGPAPADHQMQRGMAAMLDILDQLQGDGLTSSLNVLGGGVQPGAGRPACQPRRSAPKSFRLRADKLAVRAHRIGFGYVANDTADVVLAGPTSDPVGITGPDEVMTGGSRSRSRSTPSHPRSARRHGSESTARQFAAPGDDTAGVALTTTTDPSAAVIGQLPGVSWVQATLRSAGDAGPYAFTVRLRPEFAAARVSARRLLPPDECDQHASSDRRRDAHRIDQIGGRRARNVA